MVNQFMFFCQFEHYLLLKKYHIYSQKFPIQLKPNLLRVFRTTKMLRRCCLNSGPSNPVKTFTYSC